MLSDRQYSTFMLQILHLSVLIYYFCQSLIVDLNLKEDWDALSEEE